MQCKKLVNLEHNKRPLLKRRVKRKFICWDCGFENKTKTWDLVFTVTCTPCILASLAEGIGSVEECLNKRNYFINSRNTN
jgi:hypothetical protein